MNELCVLPRSRTLAATLAAALACGSCSNDPSPNRLTAGAPQVVTPDLVVDRQAALSSIANQAYASSPDFTRISNVYPSVKDPVDVEEWVSTAAVQAYAQIGPDLAAANVTLPTGTIIVRAVSALPDAGGDGTIQELTVMVKGPPGTDQDVDDWWFAVTDPNGNPLPGADGGLQEGPMTADCHSCHLGQGSGKDFLFGVAVANRPGVDWPTVLGTIANQAYASSSTFTAASTEYGSAKDPVDIAEWVTTSAATAYAKIDPSPDAGPADVTLPTGAMIVRAVYPLPDAGMGNEVQKLTVMVKGPPGSDPDLGDWAFAVTDPSGAPLAFPDGGLQEGLLTDDCHSCHRDQRGSANDYLFGVPASDRP